MNQISPSSELAKTLLIIIFFAMLIGTSLWIVRPFILSLSWAGMVVIATWPVLLRLQKLLWNKRLFAVLTMTLLLTLLFVIPVGLLTNSIVDKGPDIIKWTSDKANFDVLTFEWLQKIPYVGPDLFNYWTEFIGEGGKTLVTKIQPYIGQATRWFLSQVVHVGSFLLHSLLMVLFSALLFYRGEMVAASIKHFALRLSPNKGDVVITLASQAIRAVALGIVVTALMQSILGGIGLSVAGIKYATLLTVVMFILCLAQLGPMLILIPAVIWLYYSGDNTWGTVLLAWTLVVGTMDNFVRPLLIKLGADLPLLLILMGVIGGLLAFGMIGLFIGPVVLAVAYRLVSVWVNEVKNHPEHIVAESLLNDGVEPVQVPTPPVKKKKKK